MAGAGGCGQKMRTGAAVITWQPRCRGWWVRWDGKGLPVPCYPPSWAGPGGVAVTPWWGQGLGNHGSVRGHDLWAGMCWTGGLGSFGSVAQSRPGTRCGAVTRGAGLSQGRVAAPTAAARRMSRQAGPGTRRPGRGQRPGCSCPHPGPLPHLGGTVLPVPACPPPPGAPTLGVWELPRPGEVIGGCRGRAGTPPPQAEHCGLVWGARGGGGVLAAQLQQGRGAQLPPYRGGGGAAHYRGKAVH